MKPKKSFVLLVGSEEHRTVAGLFATEEKQESRPNPGRPFAVFTQGRERERESDNSLTLGACYVVVMPPKCAATRVFRGIF
jgi:hypothetical protein